MPRRSRCADGDDFLGLASFSRSRKKSFGFGTAIRAGLPRFDRVAHVRRFPRGSCSIFLQRQWFVTESWWLKLDRAEKHLQELEVEICRYGERRPYLTERLVQPKGQRHLWKYAIRFTEQPDQNIALIVGDAAHNMRCALDHLAVAMSDKRHRALASFPIESKPIWDADGQGRLPRQR